MKKYNNSKALNVFYRIVSTILLVLIVLFALAFIDTLLVKKFNTGPLFAINTKKYDTGTEEYYGLFYKVIKYKEIGGKYDTVLGTWSLKYDNDPLRIDLFDMAVEYIDNTKNTTNAFRDKYILINDRISYIDKDKNMMRFTYDDESSKYDIKMDIYFYKTIDFSKYQVGDNITIVGIVKDFKQNPNKVLVKNAFIK